MLSNWNPAADLNNDGIVDIFDLVRVGRNFGAGLAGELHNASEAHAED